MVIGRTAQIRLKVLASLLLLACVAAFLYGVFPIFASTGSPVQYYGSDAQLRISVQNESITFVANDTWYAFSQTGVTRVDNVSNLTISVGLANYTFNSTHIQLIGAYSNATLLFKNQTTLNVSYYYLAGYVNFTIYSPDNNTVYFNKTHVLGMVPFMNITTNVSFRYCGYTPWLNGTYFNLVNSSLNNMTWSNTTSNWVWDTVVNNTWMNLSFMCHNGTNTSTTEQLKAYAIGNWSFTNSSIFMFRIQASTTNTPSLVSGFANNTYYKTPPIANISTAEGTANCTIIINSSSTSAVGMINTTLITSTPVYWTNATTLDAQISRSTSSYTETPYNITFLCRDAFLNNSWYNASTSGTYQFIWIDKSIPRWSNVSYNGNQTDNVSNWTAVYASGNAFTFNVTLVDSNSTISKALFNISSSAVNYTGSRVGSTDNFSVTIDVPVGTWSFKWFFNDSADNQNSTNARLFNVTQNTTAPVTLLLNGVANQNTSISYLTNVNATIVAQGIQTATMYMDLNASGSWANATTLRGTNLDPDGGTWMNVTNKTNTNLDLPNGTYAFIVNVTGALNYTANATGANYSIVVNKGVSNISLWIGTGLGRESNISVTQGETLNLTASINTSYAVVLELNATMSLGWANRQSTATSLTNVSDTSTYLVGNRFNITAHFAGDVNYTGDTQTYWLNITTAPTTTTTSAGSAGSTQTTPGKLVKSFTSIIPESPKTVTEADLSSIDAKLTGIQLQVKSRVSSVEMTVESLSSKPSGVSTDAAPKVLKYMSISFSNIAETNVQSAKVSFKVEKAWLTQNGLAASNVALYRYANGVWNKLGTTKTSEDTLYAYYEATTPGFSYFAIGGETAAVTTTTAPAAATTTTVPVTTVTTLPGGVEVPTDWITPIIVVVLIAAVLLAVWKFKLVKF